MTGVDWSAGLLGFCVGTVASTVFFMGLALGMHFALLTDRPVRVLMLSALVRIAALLGVGWGTVAVGGPFALAGFALSFFTARTIATTFARPGAVEGPKP